MTNVPFPKFRVFPPYAAISFPVAAVILEFLLPVGLLPPFGSWVMSALGIVMGIGAGYLATSASKRFQAAGTPVDPRKTALELVQTGPYRFSRNPMYLGMITLQWALGLLFSLDWAVLLSPLLWAMLHFGAVLHEEAFLSQKFGAPYLDFIARTRRWI